MMAGTDWRSTWESMRSISPYFTFRTTPERTIHHWDRASKKYDSQTVGVIDEKTWELLSEEGIVPNGGSVLDIGCGTGALTERFALAGAEVLGLDISPKMLSLAKERCAHLGRASFVCHDWNAFPVASHFDLVFSSFCPAVDGLSAVLRMEMLSRETCCLVSLGHSSGDRTAFDVWANMGNPRMSMESYDPLYPFNVLKDMGREPVLRSFDVQEEVEISEEGMVEQLASFISLFHDLSDRTMGAIRDAVSVKAVDGHLSWREERTVRVLHWSPRPQRS